MQPSETDGSSMTRYMLFLAGINTVPAASTATESSDVRLSNENQVWLDMCLICRAAMTEYKFMKKTMFDTVTSFM